jgi:hypothetical protein
MKPFALMAAKYLLYFTAGERIVYRRSPAGLEVEASFTSNASELDGFREYLARRRKALFYVIADLAGEDFHEDQIPYLRGRDRKAVLARRLAQRYRDPRIAAALSLGYMSGERRNERVLLTSFTDTLQFEPWLNELAAAGARLAGLYSVPLVAPALAACLDARGGRVILVTVTRAGLRQCFIEDGRLRFARLERVPADAPADLASLVRSETGRLVQYLTTLRVLPREGPPPEVLVIAPRGQHERFARALAPDAQLAFRVVDFEAAVRSAGAGRAPAQAGAERLFLELAVKKPPAEQLARGEERRGFLLWQLQRAVVAAGVAVFAGCGAYAGALWLDAREAQSQAQMRQREARLAADEYDRITAAFPVTQTSTTNLKATVVEFRNIAARSASPEVAFGELSGVLERFPQFELDSLNWGVGRPEPAARAAKPSAEVPTSRAEAAAAQEHAEVLQISGRVTATRRSDYRAITAQVQSFAAALEALPGFRLVRTQLPFDVTPEGTLTGDIGAADSDEAPRFTVVLARTLK